MELLCRILRAVGGGDVVGYAAALLVSDGRRQVVLTSDRGRGWLPPGSVVPAEAASPWDHPAAVWEGLTDPVRVLVEYAATERLWVAAVAATHGTLPAGVPGAHVEAGRRAHPELLSGPVCGRVAWQARELAAAVRTWPAADDPHRQAMACAWLAHQRGTDPDNLRGGILRAVFGRQRQGSRTVAARTAGLAWQPLSDRADDLAAAEARARLDAVGVQPGCLDGTAAEATRPLLATLYADEATLALLQPEADALEAALYSAAMLGVGPP